MFGPEYFCCLVVYSCMRVYARVGLYLDGVDELALHPQQARALVGLVQVQVGELGVLVDGDLLQGELNGGVLQDVEGWRKTTTKELIRL